MNDYSYYKKIHDTIRESGSHGITSKQLAIKLNEKLSEVTESVKFMMSRGLVKKSDQNSNRRENVWKSTF